VIGEPLDPGPFQAHLGRLAAAAEPGRFLDAAHAIMTTDTFPKVATRTVRAAGGEIALSGIAKGAGMIAPDLATMLSFVFTDAPIGHAALQACLVDAVAGSFNAITIDGDTSTSDTVMAFATGSAAAGGVAELDSDPGALEGVPAGTRRSLPRSRPSGGPGWGRSDQVCRDPGQGRGFRCLCQG
jgi:glutamate N-acetyltransferase/amino-acid N-acetyltransferase